MARLRARSILGLGIKLLISSFCFLRFCSIFGHDKWVLPFVLALFSLGPLALITSLARFHLNFRRMEGIWNNQRLPKRLGDRGKRRRDGRDLPDLRMVIKIPWQPQSKVSRDSCSGQGFVPCHVEVVTR